MRTYGSQAQTHGLLIEVAPRYLPDSSDPTGASAEDPTIARPRFAFAYRLRLHNQSDQRLRVVARRWVIRDADGEERVVEGEGVVGLQPTLNPGDHFTYASTCPLPTRWGTMEGTLTIEPETGERFSAAVGRFYLVAPEEAAVAMS
ncbi:MAG: Co2+/Mg2+ efflux protein ApaG [Planctomycetota bacterium]|nr:Co2+/Mg2+ efflux protein ApaG [Planctomycetota bacterium]